MAVTQNSFQKQFMKPKMRLHIDIQKTPNLKAINDICLAKVLLKLTLCYLKPPAS